MIVAGLIVLLSASQLVAAPQPTFELTGEAGVAPIHPSGGNSSLFNGTTLNNTSARLGDGITSFVRWFTDGLLTVIALVFAVLLLGGVTNYVLVGRKRGEWSPAQAVKDGISPGGGTPPDRSGPGPGQRSS